MKSDQRYVMPRPGSKQHQVFTALRASTTPMSHADVVQATGLSSAEVSQGLFWLTRRGLLARSGDWRMYFYTVLRSVA